MSGDIDDFRGLLAKVGNGETLGIDEAERAFDIMTSGDATPAQMGAFLMGLKVRGEAEKAQADKSHDTPLARAVAFGASKGYAFTADEAKAHATAKAKADGKVLTDAELDGVAGGVIPGVYIYGSSGNRVGVFGDFRALEACM